MSTITPPQYTRIDSETAASEMAVVHPKATAFLVNWRKNRFFHPFIGRECGLAEAADTSKISKSLMAYWVGKFKQIGLLKQLPTTKSSHPMYTATANCFVVRSANVPVEAIDDLYDMMAGEIWWRWFKRSNAYLMEKAGGVVFKLFRTMNHVSLTMDIEKRNPEQSHKLDTAVNAWARLHLSDDHMIALHNDLLALRDKYNALSIETHQGTQIILHVAAMSAHGDMRDGM